MNVPSGSHGRATSMLVRRRYPCVSPQFCGRCRALRPGWRATMLAVVEAVFPGQPDEFGPGRRVEWLQGLNVYVVDA